MHERDIAWTDVEDLLADAYVTPGAAGRLLLSHPGTALVLVWQPTGPGFGALLTAYWDRHGPRGQRVRPPGRRRGLRRSRRPARTA